MKTSQSKKVVSPDGTEFEKLGTLMMMRVNPVWEDSDQSNNGFEIITGLQKKLIKEEIIKQK